MKTALFKTSIYNKLSAYGTFFEAGAVPDSPGNPYGVYQLSGNVDGLNDDNYCRQCTLHIDLYYHNATKDIAALQTLADNIENGFSDNPFGSGTGFVYEMHSPSRQENLPTSDEFTFRIRLNWTIDYEEGEIL